MCALVVFVLHCYPTSLQTFADWGVDMLKMDGCNVDIKLMDTGYPAMALSLNLTQRPIIFSCSWPDYERMAGIAPNYQRVAEYCNLWRNFDDIGVSRCTVITYYLSYINVHLCELHGVISSHCTVLCGHVVARC